MEPMITDAKPLEYQDSFAILDSKPSYCSQTLSETYFMRISSDFDCDL